MQANDRKSSKQPVAGSNPAGGVSVRACLFSQEALLQQAFGLPGSAGSCSPVPGCEKDLLTGQRSRKGMFGSVAASCGPSADSGGTLHEAGPRTTALLSTGMTAGARSGRVAKALPETAAHAEGSGGSEEGQGARGGTGRARDGTGCSIKQCVTVSNHISITLIRNYTKIGFMPKIGREWTRVRVGKNRPSLRFSASGQIIYNS